MLSVFQALILGLVQGISELFPISSLGHSVIIPSLVGWHLDQQDPVFITFIVVTHIATALVLFLFFFADWKLILQGLGRSLRTREIRQDDTYARIGWLLIVSSVPVGILGILFEKQFSMLFAIPLYAGYFLIGNGIVLYIAEWFIHRRPIQESHSYERVAHLSWIEAIKIGLVQCLALLPGFSRTGATLAGSLMVGLSHEDAARYAFLLATPIIFAAGVLKIPELVLSGEAVNMMIFVVGAGAAALGAYVSVRFLTRYFKTHTLIPFAYYCAAVGLITICVSLLH